MDLWTENFKLYIQYIVATFQDISSSAVITSVFLGILAYPFVLRKYMSEFAWRRWRAVGFVFLAFGSAVCVAGGAKFAAFKFKSLEIKHIVSDIQTKKFLKVNSDVGVLNSISHSSDLMDLLYAGSAKTLQIRGVSKADLCRAFTHAAGMEHVSAVTVFLKNKDLFASIERETVLEHLTSDRRPDPLNDAVKHCNVYESGQS